MIKLKENPIEGVIITMAGFEIVVAALNMRQIKALRPEITKMDKEKDPDKKFDATLKVIHEALRRNYPEIELSEVEDLVDMNNVGDVTFAVMGSSGLQKTMGKITPATP